MTLRQTHTHAILEISKPAFDEIAAKLKESGYDHAFIEDRIDMAGIALKAAERPNLIPEAMRSPQAIQKAHEHFCRSRPGYERLFQNPRCRHWSMRSS